MKNKINSSEYSNASICLQIMQEGQVVRLNHQGFELPNDNIKSRSIKIVDDEKISPEWLAMQNEALPEYLSTHKYEKISKDTFSLYKLFGNYIGNELYKLGAKINPTVLDVGCGIDDKYPKYVRHLKNDIHYFGIDAIDINHEREYPFICSRLEKLANIKGFHNNFDVFIFGTSLDHFENLTEVSAAIKVLASRGAIAIFWLGLHDTSAVAAEEGVQVLKHIFDGSSYLAIVWRLIKFVFWKFPRLMIVIKFREYRLKNKQKLDSLHFWYFQDKDLPDMLSLFGEVMDIIHVPGGGSVFATVRISVNEEA